jgi:hypothetical protein
VVPLEKTARNVVPIENILAGTIYLKVISRGTYGARGAPPIEEEHSMPIQYRTS